MSPPHVLKSHQLHYFFRLIFGRQKMPEASKKQGITQAAIVEGKKLLTVPLFFYKQQTSELPFHVMPT